MKKLVLILFLLHSAHPSRSQTSVYHPFPDSNAVWNVNYYLWQGCLPFSDLYEDYSMVLNGDTTINSMIYHKMTTPCVVSNCSPPVINSVHKGSIRQDTVLRTVYLIPPGDSVEHLLYDFNMQIGDTIQGFLNPWTGFTDTVESIDSILIGNGYRKRWLTNSCYQIYFIEGIGSTFGVLEKSPGCITDAPSYSLTCFSQNGQTLYPSPTTSCEVILGVKSMPENNFSISVFPNPFHSSTTFTIKGDPGIRNAELKIYNSFGKHISTKIIQGESATIDRKGWTGGIYFYQLLDEKKNGILANGKFIIE